MKILWLKTELLHPVDKGGRIRTYQMLRELRKSHEITYLTLDDGTAGEEEIRKADEYCHELIRIPHARAPKFTPKFFAELAANVFSDLPYFLQKYRADGMRAEIERRDRDGSYDVLVCDFLVPAVNLPGTLDRPAVLFQHNVEAEIWRRHAEVASDPIRTAYFRSQWRRTVAFERAVSQRFDRIVAVSRQDKQTFEREYDLTDVAVVETGVDIDFFRPTGRPIVPKRIVFTGSMDWLPNVDGMQWFVGEVFPAIKERHPDASLAIVGRDPGPPVRQLAEGRDDVIVTGTVDDVRPWVEEAAVYVVPLRIGGGTRLKIYEAMALERPVVSTAVGMEGLPIHDGEELRIVDEPARFAEQVSDLLSDADEARALGLRAAERVRSDFGWSTVSLDFSRFCEEARDGVSPVGSEPSSEEEEVATCV
ncbi:MAG: glycosyltransferase [Gemmatimonadetes bacterium]|nr:glycosyltransferase [Gemmatimonadota bacterium]